MSLSSRFPATRRALLEDLRREKIIGGLHLGEFYPELANHLLLCFTELVSRAAIDRLVEVCRKQVSCQSSVLSTGMTVGCKAHSSELETRQPTY